MKKLWTMLIVMVLITVVWDANHENRGLRQLVFETWLGIDLKEFRLKECNTLHLQNICN